MEEISHLKSVLIHNGLAASARAFAQESTGREELVIVGHADWRVHSAEKGAQLGRAAFLNEDVELVCFCDDFLEQKRLVMIIKLRKMQFRFSREIFFFGIWIFCILHGGIVKPF